MDETISALEAAVTKLIDSRAALAEENKRLKTQLESQAQEIAALREQSGVVRTRIDEILGKLRTQLGEEQ